MGMLHGHGCCMACCMLLQNRDAWCMHGCMARCCFKTGMHGACVWHVASRMFESSKFAAM
jgi:hypothetical protein